VFDYTVTTYYDEIFRYCYHNVGNKEIAEDICQDTFVSYIEHQSDYQSRGKLKNYLYTIARNKCIDYFKKSTPIYMGEVPGESYDNTFEVEIEVKQMLQTLPEELRQVIILRFFQNLKFKDIASIMGTNTSNVKYKVKKALELLQSEV